MGLPLSLDGLPDKLKLKNPVECPACKRQVTVFRKGRDAEGHVAAVCGLCKKPIPNNLLSEISNFQK